MSFFRFLVAIVGFVMIAANVVSAEDFAIETTVYSGDETKPTASYLTIFYEQKIYDVCEVPNPTTIVFDRTSRDFQIANSAAAMRSSITSEELMRLAASLREQAKEARDPLIRFAVDPKFKCDFDKAKRHLSMTSDVWDYHVDVRIEQDPQVLARYREFADWFSYLNSAFRPLPPGLRLELNGMLQRYQAIPEKVVVHVKRTGDKQRSEHRWVQPLGSRELEAVEKWSSLKETLPAVNFAKYHAATRQRR